MGRRERNCVSVEEGVEEEKVGNLNAYTNQPCPISLFPLPSLTSSFIPISKHNHPPPRFYLPIAPFPDLQSQHTSLVTPSVLLCPFLLQNYFPQCPCPHLTQINVTPTHIHLPLLISLYKSLAPSPAPHNLTLHLKSDLSYHCHTLVKATLTDTHTHTNKHLYTHTLTSSRLKGTNTDHPCTFPYLSTLRSHKLLLFFAMTVLQS